MRPRCQHLPNDMGILCHIQLGGAAACLWALSDRECAFQQWDSHDWKETGI